MTKVKKGLLALASLPFALAATPASAALVFQTNFDSLAVAPGGYTIVNAIEGWTASDGAGIELQNHAAGDPFSESNLVELDSNNNSAMSRMIGPGTYSLDFYYSARPGQPSTTNGIDVLLGGGSIYSVTGNGGSNTSWLLQHLTFTTTSNTTLTFAATGTNDSLGGYLDNIRLMSGVPEPTTWSLMIMGIGGIGFQMRRTRRTTGQLQTA